MINKDKNLINKFPQDRRHPISSKFDCYRNNNNSKNFVKEYVFYNYNINGGM